MVFGPFQINPHSLCPFDLLLDNNKFINHNSINSEWFLTLSVVRINHLKVNNFITNIILYVLFCSGLFRY